MRSGLVRTLDGQLVSFGELKERVRQSVPDELSWTDNQRVCRCWTAQNTGRLTVVLPQSPPFSFDPMKRVENEITQDEEETNKKAVEDGH